MTDPLDKLAQWRELTDAAYRGPWHAGTEEYVDYGSVIGAPEYGRAPVLVDDLSIFPGTAEFIATSRTAMPALLTAVENVLKEHEESWSCGNPRHTNPEVGCPDCWVECDTCGCTYPCVTVMAIRDAIGGAE